MKSLPNSPSTALAIPHHNTLAQSVIAVFKSREYIPVGECGIIIYKVVYESLSGTEDKQIAAQRVGKQGRDSPLLSKEIGAVYS